MYPVPSSPATIPYMSECSAFKMDQIVASALPSEARLECHNGHGSVWLGALAQHYLWHSNGHMSSNSQLPPSQLDARTLFVRTDRYKLKLQLQLGVSVGFDR